MPASALTSSGSAGLARRRARARRCAASTDGRDVETRVPQRRGDVRPEPHRVVVARRRATATRTARGPPRRRATRPAASSCPIPPAPRSASAGGAARGAAARPARAARRGPAAAAAARSSSAAGARLPPRQTRPAARPHPNHPGDIAGRDDALSPARADHRHMPSSNSDRGVGQHGWSRAGDRIDRAGRPLRRRRAHRPRRGVVTYDRPRAGRDEEPGSSLGELLDLPRLLQVVRERGVDRIVHVGDMFRVSDDPAPTSSATSRARCTCSRLRASPVSPAASCCCPRRPFTATTPARSTSRRRCGRARRRPRSG